jgi:hypothetical protein
VPAVRISRRRRVFAAAAVVAVGLLSSACVDYQTTASATKSISGTIKGADGRYVDVMIGFDVVDANNNKINMGLLPQTGYSTIQRLNYCLPASGSASVVTCGNGKSSTFNWKLNLPANARQVYIEVYPKDPNNTDWLNNYRGYTGPAAGNTNLGTYGMTFRRAIPVNGAVTNVGITLPKVCGQPGGTTGKVTGHISGLNGATGTINAWSMSDDGNISMGFGMGTIDHNGNYVIDKLQSGQRYGLIASAGGRVKNLVDYQRKVSNDTFVAAPCFNKVFNFGM